MRYPVLFTVIVSSLVLGWTPDAYAGERAPLRILLTNDDGYDAPGIRAMHEHLVAAGHDVTLVAPLSDQSGSGIRVTTQGKLHYEDHAPAVWSVDGTPADSVLVGLRHILADDPPDLVVSGANFGPNLGYAGSSGTVGAARMATLFSAFAGAAEFVVALIDDLARTSGEAGRLLPQHTVLSINYPPVSSESIKGTRVLRSTWDPGVRINYAETGESGDLQVGLQVLDAAVVAGDDQDWQLLARKYITISVFDGDPNSPDEVRDDVAQRINSPTTAKAASPSPGEISTAVFDCGDKQNSGFSVVTRTGPGEIAVWLPLRFGRPYLVLGQVPAASGTKYEGDGVLLWTHGDEALLEVDDEHFSGCAHNQRSSIWEHAKLGGVSFRAVGNEPGWYLELRNGESAKFVYGYGQNELTLPLPVPLENQEARQTTYDTQDDEHRLTIRIIGTSCVDSMSGEQFESSVVVDMDGRTYQGCGRALH
jgi:broad specificity polyphosphatase/5'/3'-nucleotidase SurE/uncharacterized membrane protein